MPPITRRTALALLATAPCSLYPASPHPDRPRPQRRLNLPVPANPGLPTLFLVGDCTVRNGKGDGANNQMGWANRSPPSLTPPRSTPSTASSMAAPPAPTSLKATGPTLAMLKPGDAVLFQFGHNDGGVPDEPTRARAFLPGTGPETQLIENPILKRHETVHTFGWYMANYVDDTLAKGATPILCSLIPCKIWKDGKIVRDTTYAVWTR